MNAVSQALGPSGLWYLSRGTGAVTFVCLTASVVLGVTTSSGHRTQRFPRFVLQALHRNLSLIAVVLLGVHIATAILDGFAPISVTDAFVPFVAKYRGLWLGLGALSLDLVLAVLVTTLARHRLGYRGWRAVHLLAYGAWPLALVHSLGTGTDTRAKWMLALYGACTLAVCAALVWRLTTGWPQTAPRALRRGLVAASAATAAAICIWLVQGPLAPGWAKRAGTPTQLLQAAGSQSAQALPPPRVAALPDPPFTSPLSGAVKSQTDPQTGDATITLAAALSATPDGHLTVTLRGQPLQGGGVSLSSGRVALGTSRQPDLYQGAVSQLSGGRLVATLSDAQGRSARLTANLNADSSSVSGQATVAPLVSGSGR